MTKGSRRVISRAYACIAGPSRKGTVSLLDQEVPGASEGVMLRIKEYMSESCTISYVSKSMACPSCQR